MELLIPFPLADELVNRIRGVSSKLRVTVIPSRKMEDIPTDVWSKTEILYTDRIVPAPIQVPNLKWIQFTYAGIDRWLKEPILYKSGLLITNLSGAGAPKVAEYAVMMLLALGHKLPALITSQHKADWPKDRWQRFSAFELRGATIGIIGYGSVGRQIARLLQPFGVTILATKKDAMHPEDSGYIPDGIGDPGGDFVHRLYPAEAIRSMLKLCDFAIVCVPLTPATRNMIGNNVLAAMKTGSCLIDVSRGGVLDHSALIKALQDGKLSGAALDVFPEEPLPASSPLWNMSNVLISPHIADSSPHFDERGVTLFCENLHRYIAGMSLYNLFDHQRGY